MASLNEGGADADAELVDGQRFLKRMNMLNSTARRLPSVEKGTSGRRLDPERALQRAADHRRWTHTNQDLFSPKRQFAKFTAFDPCGVDRQTLMRVTGRTPSPVKKKARAAGWVSTCPGGTIWLLYGKYALGIGSIFRPWAAASGKSRAASVACRAVAPASAGRLMMVFLIRG